MTVRIVLNSGAVREYLRGPAGAVLDDPASQVLGRARELAPVDEQSDHPGEYRDSLQVITPHGYRRAVRYVGSTVPYADQVEMRHGVLGKALG